MRLVGLVVLFVLLAAYCVEASNPVPAGRNTRRKRKNKLPRCQSFGGTHSREKFLAVDAGDEVFAGYSIRVPNPLVKHTKVAVGDVNVDYHYECPDRTIGVWSCGNYVPPALSCNGGVVDGTCVHNVSDLEWYPTADVRELFSYSLACTFPPLCKSEFKGLATITRAVLSVGFSCNPTGDLSVRFRYGKDRSSTTWSDEFAAEGRKFCRLGNREEDEAILLKKTTKALNEARSRAEAADAKAHEEARRTREQEQLKKLLVQQNMLEGESGASCVEDGTCSANSVYEAVASTASM